MSPADRARLADAVRAVFDDWTWGAHDLLPPLEAVLDAVAVEADGLGAYTLAGLARDVLAAFPKRGPVRLPDYVEDERHEL